MFIKVIKNQKGVTLLMSLVIMSTVVAVAIGVSVLIINQYQFSANVDHSISAYYAAETGIEAKLANIKTYRDNQNFNLTDSNPTKGVIAAINASAGATLSNNASWVPSATATQDVIMGNLKQNQKITVDLFNPDALSSGGGVDSVYIDWRDDCNGAGWLKLSDTTINAQGIIDLTTNSPYENLFACGEVNACTQINEGHYSPTSNYRLILTPIYCNVSYLKIRAYTGANNTTPLAPLSNRINLKSVGTYADSKIALNASVPWQLSSQGIFDFVLFSQEQITK